VCQTCIDGAPIGVGENQIRPVGCRRSIGSLPGFIVKADSGTIEKEIPRWETKAKRINGKKEYGEIPTKPSA
jgi:hypothetical protein